jgi:hypothetical protein
VYGSGGEPHAIQALSTAVPSGDKRWSWAEQDHHPPLANDVGGFWVVEFDDSAARNKTFVSSFSEWVAWFSREWSS